MKKFSWLFLMAWIAFSCQVNDEIVDPSAASQSDQQSGKLGKSSSAREAGDVCGEVQSFNLWAGQTIDAGTLEVYNNESSLFVVYTAENGWLLTETHLYVGLNPPKNNKGIIVPGQFPYKGTHDYVGSVTYEIPLSELGDCFNVYAHAVVKKKNDAGQVTDEQTAFGGDTPGTGPRWFFFTNYCVQDCEEVEECEPANETGWADGTPYNNEQGNWATFVEYDPNGEGGNELVVNLYAGQNQLAGTVSFTKVWYSPINSKGYVDITIQLNDCFGFADVAENVKIQNYTFPPDGNPEPGLFEIKGDGTGTVFMIQVPYDAFYGVHVDLFGGCCE
jgi:hypothetical protein